MRARSFRLLGAIFICAGGLASLAPAAITLPSVVGVDSVGTTDYPNGGIVETGKFMGFLKEDNAACAIVSPDGELAWIGLERRPSGIVEIDISNDEGQLERLRAADLPPNTQPIRAAGIDPLGEFGYFLAATSFAFFGETSHLFKVDLATLEPVAQADFEPVENAGCLAVDPAGTHAYVGLLSTPGRIIRFNLATMEREGELTLPAADSILVRAEIDAANEFGYFISRSAGLRIVKVRLSDFTRENSETIDAVALDLNGFALEPSGAFGYLTTAEATGRFLRINLNTLAGVQEATLPAGLGQLGGICVNAAGTTAIGYSGRLDVLTVDLATLNGTVPGIPSSYGFPLPPGVVRVPGSSEGALAFSRGTSPVYLETAVFGGFRTALFSLEGGERDFKAMTLDPDNRFCFLSGGVTYPIVAAVDPTTLERLDGHGSPLLADSTATAVATLTRLDWLAGLADNGADLSDFSGGGFARVFPQIPIGVNSSTSSETPEGPLSLAYSPPGDVFYYCVRDAVGPAVVRSSSLGFASVMDLFTLADGETARHMAANLDGSDFYFARTPAGFVGRYHGGTIDYSEGLFGELAAVMRNRATGEILAVQAGTPGSAFGLDPTSLDIQRNLNLTALPGVEAQGILAAALDPQFGRFAVYSAAPAQIVRHDMADFSKAGALPTDEAPTALALDPDGARLFAYYSGANEVGRYQLTPRSRIEGTRFRLAETAEAESVAFYSHAAVPARRVHVELVESQSQPPFGAAAFDRTRNRIWYAPNSNAGLIHEYDPASREFLRVAIAFDLNQVISGAAGASGVYGCFGDNSSPANVARLDLETGLVVNRTLNSGENRAGAAAVDPAGEFAYFAVRTTPAKIVKFQLSDFTRVGELSLASTENNVSDLVIDGAGQFMYAPFTTGGLVSSCGVVKIQLNSFSRVGALPGSGSGANKAAIDPAGAHLYVAAASPLVFNEPSPGLINRYQLSDFTPAGTLTLQDDEAAAFALAIDPDGEFLLASVSGNPAGIVRVDLSTFTREAAYRLRKDTEVNVRTMHLDDEGEYAFLGLNTNPGRVVTFEVNPKPLRLAIYEDFGAFFVRRWQSQALAPAAGVWVSYSMVVGEPDQLTLDPGDYLLAWQFDADEFGPSHQTGSPGDGVRVIFPYGEFPDSITQGAFGRSTDAASPETSGWTETSSLWSAYLSYEPQNSAVNWETLE